MVKAKTADLVNYLAKSVVVAKFAWKLHQASCPSTAWWHYEAEVYIFIGCIISLHVKFMFLYTQLQTCYFSLEISANVITLHNLIRMKIWAWCLLFIKKPCTNLKRSWIITNKTQVFPKETLFICICRDIPAVKTSAEPCASWYQHSLCKFLRWYTHIITTI